MERGFCVAYNAEMCVCWLMSVLCVSRSVSEFFLLVLVRSTSPSLVAL